MRTLAVKTSNLKPQTSNLKPQTSNFKRQTNSLNFSTTLSTSSFVLYLLKEKRSVT
jgi:hypothetical protein